MSEKSQFCALKQELGSCFRGQKEGCEFITLGKTITATFTLQICHSGKGKYIQVFFFSVFLSFTSLCVTMNELYRYLDR